MNYAVLLYCLDCYLIATWLTRSLYLKPQLFDLFKGVGQFIRLHRELLKSFVS